MITKKSKERIKKNGEVFTPDRLVNQMLRKLPKEVWQKNKTFLDNSCGNGQFLVWILIRKIQKGHNPLKALQSIYGCDIMRDNIKECRLRLLKIIDVVSTIKEEHIKAIMQNIVWINPEKYPEGSLEYDYSFENKINNSDVERWMKYIHQDHVLDDVELPINEEIFKRYKIIN